MTTTEHVSDNRQPGEVYEIPDSVTADQLSAFAELGVSTTASVLGPMLPRTGALSDRGSLPRITGEGCVAGRAFTVWNPPGSTRMMKPALEMITPLDVLVIASDRETASWGDIATSMAIPRGVRGVIVDGAVRDVDRIAATGFSVWASRVYAGEQRIHRAPGALNIPIRVGPLVVSAGDVIVADGDGIVAISPDLVDQALAAATRSAEREERILKATRAGEMPAEWTAIYESADIKFWVDEVQDDPIRKMGTTWSARS